MPIDIFSNAFVVALSMFENNFIKHVTVLFVIFGRCGITPFSLWSFGLFCGRNIRFLHRYKSKIK
jgi:hypothetical protein